MSAEITFRPAARERLFVYVEGRRVGTIYPLYGGLATQYQYSTLRGQHGDIYDTLSECKRSLADTPS